MKEKELKTIVTFHNVTEAIRMEKLCKESGMPGRLIPVPRAISASCGMSWMAPASAKDQLLAFIEEKGVTSEGLFEIEM